MARRRSASGADMLRQMPHLGLTVPEAPQPGPSVIAAIVAVGRMGRVLSPHPAAVTTSVQDLTDIAFLVTAATLLTLLDSPCVMMRGHTEGTERGLERDGDTRRAISLAVGYTHTRRLVAI
jgi:hypothetical protein